MAALLGVPANLPQLVRTAFERARSAGDLIFFPTQVALLRVGGIPFQLRFAPSLGKKPKTPKDSKSQDAKMVDPFKDPLPSLLVVPQLGPAHRLVLNKFAVSRDHAILATSVFQPQNYLLDAADLAAAYACIEAYHAGGEAEELYVFYNSGQHSGASQPHRHLQLLPVAQMRQGLQGDDAAAWGVLVDRVAGDGTGDRLPFYVAAAQLAPSPSAEQLHATYLRLYRQARAAARGTSACLVDRGRADDASADDEEERGRVPARISYNLALTRTAMAILPRTAEGSALALAAGRDPSGGFVSLNGTVLAGTALVKNEAEWEALQSDPTQLLRVLEDIGVSPRASAPASL